MSDGYAGAETKKMGGLIHEVESKLSAGQELPPGASSAKDSNRYGKEPVQCKKLSSSCSGEDVEKEVSKKLKRLSAVKILEQGEHRACVYTVTETSDRKYWEAAGQTGTCTSKADGCKKAKAAIDKHLDDKPE